MGQTTKTKRFSLSGLWLTVVLLLIFLLATLALLGSLISAYVAGEPNVIELMADSRAMEREHDDDFPGGALPGLEASWETETSVDLFKTAYTGPDGTVTVQSADGHKLIAPGTGNSYDFTLKNTGNISLDYTLVLDGMFRLADRDIPMFVRLRQGGAWIMGGEDSWLHVSELSKIHRSDTLPRGESAVYHFEWMWPYEADEETGLLWSDLLDTAISSDLRDTELGNVTVEVDTRFVLNITVTSGITPGAEAEFNNGASVPARYTLTCILGGLILGSGLWLILLLFLRRNIYFTGLVTIPLPQQVTMDGKEAALSSGRFTFEKTRLGKHRLTVFEEELTLRFRHDRKVRGLSITLEDDVTVISMAPDVRAVELYLLTAGRPAVNPVLWAAIDKDRCVHTPAGVVPPTEDRNRTPGGLLVDEDGRYGVEEFTHV